MNPSLIEIRMDSFVNRRKYVSHNDRTETVPLWRGGVESHNDRTGTNPLWRGAVESHNDRTGTYPF